MVFHAVSCGVNVLPQGPVTAPLAFFTEPYEKTLGLHQTWPMFGAPSRATVWARVVGIDAEGTTYDAELLPGEPDPDGVIWIYDRYGKLTRNLLDKKRGYLRDSVVRHACRTHPDWVRVRIDRFARRSPPPGAVDVPPRGEWPVDVETLSETACPSAP